MITSVAGRVIFLREFVCSKAPFFRVFTASKVISVSLVQLKNADSPITSAFARLISSSQLKFANAEVPTVITSGMLIVSADFAVRPPFWISVIPPSVTVLIAGLLHPDGASANFSTAASAPNTVVTFPSLS